MRRDLPLWALALLAMALPLLLFAVHRDLGHHGDMLFFTDWVDSFIHWEMYRAGPGVNYPFLGVVLVCGPAAAWEGIHGGGIPYDEYRHLLKATLVLAEVLTILATARLGRRLGLERPRLLAVGLYLLPATWAGGAWYGQIDVWGTLFLVLAATSLLGAWQGRLPLLTFLSAGLALAAAILTKQLTAFTLPALGLMALAALAAQPRRRLPLYAGLLVLAMGLLFAPDPYLDLPRGWSSHLAWIWAGGGSAHSAILSGNGANLWSLVSAPPDTSSHSFTWLGLSAWTWGVGAFGVAQLGLWAWLGHVAWHERRVLPAALVLYAGMSNLAMAVLLTGVHERYLVHGVPFLVLGMAAMRRVDEARSGRILEVATWVVTGWSGLFVLSSIHWEVFGWLPLLPFRSHTLTALLELGLLVGVVGWLGVRSLRPLRA